MAKCPCCGEELKIIKGIQKMGIQIGDDDSIYGPVSKEPDFQKGDKVWTYYTWKVGHGKTESTALTGIADRIYVTTFGGAVKDWGVSILLDEPHPLTRGKRMTFRATRVSKR